MNPLPKEPAVTPVILSALMVPARYRKLVPYLGICIRLLRVKAKLSQTALAQAVGVGRTTISDLENGRRTEIGATHLEDIAHRLGLTISALFAMADQISQTYPDALYTDVAKSVEV